MVTVTLNNGKIAIGRTTKYGDRAYNFANRTQALTKLAALTASGEIKAGEWAVFHWSVPFYICKITKEVTP